jgi:hypothetical protein
VGFAPTRGGADAASLDDGGSEVAALLKAEWAALAGLSALFELRARPAAGCLEVGLTGMRRWSPVTDGVRDHDLEPRRDARWAAAC